MPEINSGYPIRMIKPSYLMDAMTIFCWLDEEHQSRAISTLNSILQDQITEAKAAKRVF